MNEKSDILDGIIEYLRAEHGLTAEFTSLPDSSNSTAACWFYTIEIGKDHDLILEVRSDSLLIEEYVYMRGHRPIWKWSYELSNPAEFDKAIKTILELVRDKRGGFWRRNNYHV